MSVKRVALVGSGGTGKSTLLKMFEADGYKVFPSITREFYAARQIPNEQAYMDLPKSQQGLFQRQMRAFYAKKFTDFVLKHPNENIITDRSILDHLAYGLYGVHDQMSLHMLEAIIDTCIAFSNTAYSHLVYLPYPQPWMRNVSIEDGFRQTDPAKNYCVSTIMLGTLYYHKLILQDLKPQLSVLKASHATPEETYAMIKEGVDQ